MKNLSFLLIGSCLLVTACGSSTVKVDPSDADKARKYNEIIQKNSDLTDPVHGAQARVAYGAISGVAPVKANGIAFLKTFTDGTSVLTVNVNILKAPEGSSYSVMLKNPATKAVLDVGTLESILGDTRHSVELTTTNDLHGFSTVLVYLGKQLHAEGTLKEVKK